MRDLAGKRQLRVIAEIRGEGADRLVELYRTGLRSSLTVPIFERGGLSGVVFFNQI